MLKKYKYCVQIFAVLEIIALTVTTVFASGGAGLGSMAVASETIIVREEMREITVRGIIDLPIGFVAPSGGLEVYGAFGEVILGGIENVSEVQTENDLTGNISSGSNQSSGGSSGGGSSGSGGGSSSSSGTVTALSCPKYEKYGVIAVIPEGETCVEFETDIKVENNAYGFYGSFWVYDTDIASEDGTAYLSNKLVVSDPIRLKNKKEYNEMEVMLEKSEGVAAYELEFAESLKNESPNCSVYILANDGYDDYIAKCSFTSCDAAIGGIIRTDDRGCELTCYIPTSDKTENQKIKSGVFDWYSCDSNEVYHFYTEYQNSIHGTISRPEGDDLSCELDLKLYTSAGSVCVTIPQGESSTEYIVAAQMYSDEYLELEVLNSELYRSGYFDGESFADYRAYISLTENDKIDLTLERQCVIGGKITLPDGVVMADNTYFRLNVGAETLSGEYSDENTVTFFSDKTAEYKFYVPYQYKNEAFLITYNYGDYEPVTFPQKPKNPLNYFRQSISESGTSSGGSSSTGIVYTKKIPEGLISNRLIYLNDGNGTLYKNEAAHLLFDGDINNTDVVLARVGEINEKNSIGGYFVNVLSRDIGKVYVKLLDAESGEVKYSAAVTSKYIFDDVENGKYIISASYGGKTYYYSGAALEENTAAAKIIDTEEKAVNYGNDIYVDNIFPTDIKLQFAECYIDGIEKEESEICVYDIYGNLHSRYRGYVRGDYVEISFSPFILSIDNKFVASCRDGKTFDKLTNDFESACVIEARYRNSVFGSEWHGCDRLIIDAETIYRYSVEDVALSDDAYVIARIINNKKTISGGKIYYAAYDGKKLLDVICDNLLCDKEINEVKSSKPLNPHYCGNAEIRVFIWDDDMTPLTAFDKNFQFENI